MPRTPTAGLRAGITRAMRLAALALLGASALAMLLRDPAGDGEAERQALRAQLQHTAAALAYWQAEPAADGVQEVQHQKRARSEVAPYDQRVMQWPVQVVLQEAGRPVPPFPLALPSGNLALVERLAVPGRWGWTLHARMDVLPVLLAPSPWWQRHALPLAGTALALGLLALAWGRQRAAAQPLAGAGAGAERPQSGEAAMATPSQADLAQQGLLTLNGLGSLGARAADAAHSEAADMQAHACLRQQLHEQSEQLAWLTEQMKRRRGATAGEDA